VTSVVFYFQVHQPYRLRRYTYFDIGAKADYFDDGENRRIVERVAERCYLPMNELLLRQIEATDGRFRCSFAVTGSVLRQLEAWRPEALESFARLARTGAVEFVCETAFHSLAALEDPTEFTAQVEDQRRRLTELSGTRPTSFRDTELIFDQEIAKRVEDLGFDVLLGEGADRLLRGRSPRRVYRPAGCERLKLLLRDYRFSDDIAFRFSNRQWPAYPLMADTYASWLHRAAPEDVFIGLFMDYETFGEHQSADTGILEFMRYLPGYVLSDPPVSSPPGPRLDFGTPSQVGAANEPVETLVVPDPVSWADEERDLSAWLSNPMQRAAHEALYELAPRAREAAQRGHPELLAAWRKLSTSDHVYYMHTKRMHSDADVHEYFSPYESPHDSFIAFMNVLDDLSQRLDRALAEPADEPTPA
jgi:alpha-amylase